MKHEQLLKILSILLKKIPMKKGTLGNNSFIFKLILILTTCHGVQRVVFTIRKLRRIR